MYLREIKLALSGDISYTPPPERPPVVTPSFRVITTKEPLGGLVVDSNESTVNLYHRIKSYWLGGARRVRGCSRMGGWMEKDVPVGG